MYGVVGLSGAIFITAWLIWFKSVRTQGQTRWD